MNFEYAPSENPQDFVELPSRPRSSIVVISTPVGFSAR